MSAQVTFEIISDLSKGQRFAFADALAAVVGRDAACALRLDDARTPPQVSKRHCELILDPPAVRVRDLGSLNGTTINDLLLGSRAAPSDEVAPLFHGDKLRIADFLLQVSTSPVLCSECLNPIADEPDPLRRPQGRPVCTDCFGPGSPATAPPGEHRDAVEQLFSHAATGLPGLSPLRDYEILGELGRGAMGVVYLARHVLTRRRVAVKVMLPEHADREDLLARFRREIDLAIALSRHEHLVEVLGGGCDGDTFFYVMGYCAGGSLHDWMHGRDPLPAAEAVRLVMQVLDALHHIHNAELPNVLLADNTMRPARGVVHRDLKPANLLLTDNTAQTVKVGDLGLAKAFELAGQSGLTRTWQSVGTPKFSSRRQMLNALHAGPEVDIWATAACLYYLLTKRYVRDFPPGVDGVTAVMRQPVVPIRQRRDDVPAPLAELIDCALREPEMPEPLRFASAAEFRDAVVAVS